MPGSPERGRGLTRRDVLWTGAAVAGYALAAGPVRAEAIHTDATGLVAGMVEIPVGERRIAAYRARPEGSGPFPVVLVVHEIFGLHEYIRDVCRRLARAGYLALAPDLYARQGDPTQAASVDTIIGEIVARVLDAQVMADLDAAAAWAASNGGALAPIEGSGRKAAERPRSGPELLWSSAQASGVSRAGLFIVGFCWGGRVVWLYAAHRKDLVSGAAWYGRLSGPANALTPEQPIDLAERLAAPVLGLYGAEDSGIPLDGVFAMRKRLAGAE